MYPIILSLIVFQKKIRLAKLNKELKLPEADVFIANNGSPRRLITYFID